MVSGRTNVVVAAEMTAEWSGAKTVCALPSVREVGSCTLGCTTMRTQMRTLKNRAECCTSRTSVRDCETRTGCAHTLSENDVHTLCTLPKKRLDRSSSRLDGSKPSDGAPAANGKRSFRVARPRLSTPKVGDRSGTLARKSLKHLGVGRALRFGKPLLYND
jgi:hypothetical protein